MAEETGSQQSLARTPLFDLHKDLGGRMVPFAGYEMPLQFKGILEEHRHTRTAAGLFDVSHMGQIRLDGLTAAAAMERLVPADIVGLDAGRQRYALFTDPQGGILDDLMITNAGDHLFVVVNAACKTQDIAHIRDTIGDECQVTALADRALLALQGPAAAGVMGRFAPETAEMVFMTARQVRLLGADCLVTRSGYTGEDGFEISVPADKADALARRLLEEDEVAPIGLGARDSLRLEAGLCLYGHDIDVTTTPVEASLLWSIGKARRKGGERELGYPGADYIEEQIATGPARKRVGLLVEGRAPVREGADLEDAAGKTIGHVTSGSFGPTVGAPIAMGYVEAGLAVAGTKFNAVLRGRPVPVTVTRMPFVEQRYYRG